MSFYEPQTQKGLFGNIAAWAMGLLVLGAVVSLLGIAFGWYSAPLKGKLEARKEINSGSFRIAAYNHFYDLCAAVQSDEASLKAQREELKTSTTSDDKSRIEANIAGLTADRADAINQYNADARKTYTIGQFKASDLPYQLDISEGHTRC